MGETTKGSWVFVEGEEMSEQKKLKELKKRNRNGMNITSNSDVAWLIGRVEHLESEKQSLLSAMEEMHDGARKMPWDEIPQYVIDQTRAFIEWEKKAEKELGVIERKEQDGS